jgi:hypothetical protein
MIQWTLCLVNPASSHNRSQLGLVMLHVPPRHRQHLRMPHTSTQATSRSHLLLHIASNGIVCRYVSSQRVASCQLPSGWHHQRQHLRHSWVTCTDGQHAPTHTQTPARHMNNRRPSWPSAPRSCGALDCTCRRGVGRSRQGDTNMLPLALLPLANTPGLSGEHT